MKMISKVGALHTLPKPSTAVMDAAIGMLTVFGDEQKLKKLLTEIRDVQKHNEQVFKDASAALSEISKREKALEKETSLQTQHNISMRAELTKRSTDITNSEHRLATRISTFEQHEAQRDQELTERKAELDHVGKDLAAGLHTLGTKDKEIAARETDLASKEQRNDALRKKLRDREVRVRAAFDG